MSLIKIEDYSGSEIAKAVMEALDMVGVVNKLNINGYMIEIEGIQDKTPKGMIDDTPNKHKVTIKRDKWLGEFSISEFDSMTTSRVDEIMDMQDKNNLDFEDNIKDCEVTHRFSFENNKDIWYRHSVEIQLDKSILETDESYLKRIFNTVANYVVGTFESME